MRYTLLLSFLLAGCNGKDADTGGVTWPDSTADAVATYAEIVEASYADSVSTAEVMNTALAALVAGPSQGTLSAAREAWLDSREPYLQTEVYRFYDGPIDNPDDGPEGLLNAWPLDENYIDYTADDPDAGIINGSEAISGSSLEGLNEVGGEANVATGYHAIEFLLWGQDSSATGPGDRPHTDYVADGSGTATNQDRRGEYLMVAGELLIDHLEQVHSEWEVGAGYRAGFEANPEDAFAKALTGMIILSGFETGGERLQAALDSGSQEDEHSCFSDNTHRDMIQDVQGVLNVWQGSYTRTDGSEVTGVSIRDVVTEVDAQLAADLDAQIVETLALANALQTPFDQEIAPGSDGNARVEALIAGLRAQEELLFEVFSTFGLSVTIPE